MVTTTNRTGVWGRASGTSQRDGQTGSITVLQRVGSALNLPHSKPRLRRLQPNPRPGHRHPVIGHLILTRPRHQRCLPFHKPQSAPRQGRHPTTPRMLQRNPTPTPQEGLGGLSEGASTQIPLR